MSLFTVVGDPHADDDNLMEIGLLFDILVEVGYPVIILGDLFHTKNIIHGKAFNYVMSRISNSGLTFVILVGNHDYFDKSCEDHSLEALKTLDNVVIVDQPACIKETKALFIPYYEDIKAFHEDIELVLHSSKEVPKHLFMHQGVVGFDYGSGRLADGNGHGETHLEHFKGFQKVISGHFHKFQEKGNLMFLGTPFSHDFGESNQVKYLGVFNSETGEMSLTETPFPRHRTIHHELSDDSKADLKGLNAKLNNRDHWRIILRGTEMQIAAFDKSQLSDVKFIDEPYDSEQLEELVVKDTDSNENKYLSWAIGIKQLDQETVTLGLEILGEAK